MTKTSCPPPGRLRRTAAAILLLAAVAPSGLPAPAAAQATGQIAGQPATEAGATDSCPQPDITPGAENCSAIWSEFGVPDSRNDDPGGSHTAVCHGRFLVMHNNATRTPDWVIERLDAATVEAKFKRPASESFRPDPCVSTETTALDVWYSHSGFARGHLAASADFASDEAWMKGTFVLSNVAPQVQNGFNNSVWSSLEKRVRDIAETRGEVYVITGVINPPLPRAAIKLRQGQDLCRNEIELPLPSRQMRICGGDGDTGPATQCPKGVIIPAAFYKIVVEPNLRMNAYLLANKDHLPERGPRLKNDAYLASKRVTVSTIEDLTGYGFFPLLSEHEGHAMLDQCTSTMRR